MHSLTFAQNDHFQLLKYLQDPNLQLKKVIHNHYKQAQKRKVQKEVNLSTATQQQSEQLCTMI